MKVHHSVKVELGHKAYLLSSEVSCSLGTAQVLSPVGRHRCVVMNPPKQSETLTEWISRFFRIRSYILLLYIWIITYCFKFNSFIYSQLYLRRSIFYIILFTSFKEKIGVLLKQSYLFLFIDGFFCEPMISLLKKRT